MMFNCPVAGFYHYQCKWKINHDGSDGEKDIDGSVFPFSVGEAKQRNKPFNNPEKGNAASKN